MVIVITLCKTYFCHIGYTDHPRISESIISLGKTIIKINNSVRQYIIYCTFFIPVTVYVIFLEMVREVDIMLF